MEPEPNLVISSASQRIEDGTSIVWDDLFDNDRAAFEEALTTIQKEGPVAFVRGDENVIPFRR